MLQLSRASAFSSCYLLFPSTFFAFVIVSRFSDLVSRFSCAALLCLLRSRPKFETAQRQWQHTHSSSALFFLFLPLQRVIGA